jgi:hypothetical protein
LNDENTLYISSSLRPDEKAIARILRACGSDIQYLNIVVSVMLMVSFPYFDLGLIISGRNTKDNTHYIAVVHT